MGDFSSRNSSGNAVRRFLRRNFTSKNNLEDGLDMLNEYLGLASNRQSYAATKDESVKVPTQQHAQAVMYAPDMDGQADPGEVIWNYLRTQKGGDLQLRSILIVGRQKHTLLGLLISANPEHAHKHNWMRIGSGPWDREGRESYVCLDKVLEIPESQIQRRGVSMPERRFERIAAALRSDFGWN
ncbi:type II toxin-antitoxin system PemK/MazF family toxin [Corynebacterium sp. DSM 45110]|uniref:Type II toxin-antitoxin system PemK/MazF family toxin n=2 Tax=Corynebacterium suicordis TaxID=203264 RepID=A0ABR9ZKK6_9CORY|nr:type II toxin-antitoxin system PemK/MazF family toxin [Corynebacterium suicordis DSM 45110]